ncbi:hypothetical protein BD779DRAFT_1471758 [Infundibulicybe gibba]|nr:hypothetical protein BD779DRAFT_1471758 [Infundibulicybe gibba]
MPQHQYQWHWAQSHRQPDSKSLTFTDGVHIYAEDVGRAPGPGVPTIVFIHGLHITSIVFDIIFADDGWKHGISVSPPLQLGPEKLIKLTVMKGRSGQPHDDAGWESKRFAEDFEAVVHAFELDRPLTPCHSRRRTFRLVRSGLDDC